MWIELELMTVDTKNKILLINTNSIESLHHWSNSFNYGILKIVTNTSEIEFSFKKIEIGRKVFDAFKDALRGYHTIIDDVGYIRPLSSSKYDSGSLCSPATLIDWRTMP